MEETVLNHYLEIIQQEIQAQLIRLLNRNFSKPGKRQEELPNSLVQMGADKLGYNKGRGNRP
jgi:hypothetical protein